MSISKKKKKKGGVVWRGNFTEFRKPITCIADLRENIAVFIQCPVQCSRMNCNIRMFTQSSFDFLQYTDKIKQTKRFYTVIFLTVNGTNSTFASTLHWDGNNTVPCLATDTFKTRPSGVFFIAAKSEMPWPGFFERVSSAC